VHEHPTYRNAPSDPWQTTAVHQLPTPTRALPTDLLGAPVPTRRSHRRRTTLIAIGLGLALIAGSLTYAGVSYWYGWSSTQPEAILPSTVNAFVRLDFSPGLGQRIKLGNLAKKFPKASDRDAVEQIKRGLVNDLGLDPLSYDDIKPWLGDRVGLATWPTAGATGRCDVAALASRDDGLANAALTRVRQLKGATAFGFTVSGGYAVYARCADQNSQSAVDAVLAQAKTRTLADRPDFAGDLSALPAGQVAVAWANLPEGVTGLHDVLAGTDLGPLGLTGLRGTVLLGARATDSGVEARYRAHFGSHPSQPARNVVSELGALPGGTVVGVSADLSSFQPGTIPTNTAQVDLLNLVPVLLGATVSLSASDVRSSSAALRLVVQASDPSRASRLASALAPVGGRYTGISVNRSGNTVTASSSSYRPGTGTLSNASTFTSALDGAPADSLVAAYVDVTGVAAQSQLSPGEAAQLAPVKAAGFSAGYDGDTLVGLLRILIP
jgi:hypothetical protein